MEVAENLLSGVPFRQSQNDYDWLGHGIYFWEANPLRGLQFYQETQKRKKSSKPGMVVGAVIELGFCLDLLSSTGVDAVCTAYDDFKAICAEAGLDLPVNSGGKDSLFRNKDCAVINHLHQIRAGNPKLLPFDTVRGVFTEGPPAFEGSGINAKSHIQIAVRSPRCIKGVFRVPREELET